MIHIYTLIKQSVCMLVIAIICSFTVVACSDIPTPSDIQAEIDMAVEMQEAAHQIAEYVRSFGEDDSHPAIQFAKEKWNEQEDAIRELKEQYQEAIKAEAICNEKGKYIGRFRISHYCPCSTCNGGYNGTAVGTKLIPWYTIAVDPSVINLNDEVYIDGYGMFVAQDTGGAIKGNRIDVCVNNHSEAYKLGVVYKDVYVQEKENT